MRRFDLIRNEDGSPSFFRIGCLIVFSVCMLSYASLMLGCASSHDEASDPEEQAAEDGSVDSSAMIEDEDPSESAGEFRAQALSELNTAAHYYQDCGSLNKGFEGCSFSFSQAVLKHYEPETAAADDGFSVSLRLKSPAEDSACALMQVDSSGTFEAFDAQGQASSGCLPARSGTASVQHPSGGAQDAS